jgi:dTDP-4-dehydrorhamnose 3,5-epimerase
MAKFTPLKIEGAWLIESEVHTDIRGYFREWFRGDELERETGIKFNPIQANLSRSSRGVIRGIHFSNAKAGQAKFITCITGRIMDVVVDVRPTSATFMKWDAVDLYPNSGRSLFIAGNLGHAFQALEDETAIAYLLSSNYSPENELAINPLDSDLAIRWAISSPLLSAKDSSASGLRALLEYESITKD